MINKLLLTLAKIGKDPETAKRVRDLFCIGVCTQDLEGNVITLSTFIKEFHTLFSYLLSSLMIFSSYLIFNRNIQFLQILIS